jgi:hypothetical protein
MLSSLVIDGVARSDEVGEIDSLFSGVDLTVFNTVKNNLQLVEEFEIRLSQVKRINTALIPILQNPTFLRKLTNMIYTEDKVRALSPVTYSNTKLV